MTEIPNNAVLVSGVVAFQIIDNRPGKQQTQNFDKRVYCYINSKDTDNTNHSPWTYTLPEVDGFTCNVKTVTMKWYDKILGKTDGPEEVEAGYYSTVPVPGTVTGEYNYDNSQVKYTVNSDYTGNFPSVIVSAVTDVLYDTPDATTSKSNANDKLFIGDSNTGFNAKDASTFNKLKLYKYIPTPLEFCDITTEPQPLYYDYAFNDGDPYIKFHNTNNITDYNSYYNSSPSPIVKYVMQKREISDTPDPDYSDGIQDIKDHGYDLGLTDGGPDGVRENDVYSEGDPDYDPNSLLPDKGSSNEPTGKPGFELVHILLGDIKSDGTKLDPLYYDTIYDNPADASDFIKTDKDGNQDYFFIDEMIPVGNDHDKVLEFPLLNKIGGVTYEKDTIKLKYVKNPFYRGSKDKNDDGDDSGDGEDNYAVWTNYYTEKSDPKILEVYDKKTKNWENYLYGYFRTIRLIDSVKVTIPDYIHDANDDESTEFNNIFCKSESIDIWGDGSGQNGTNGDGNNEEHNYFSWLNGTDPKNLTEYKTQLYYRQFDNRFVGIKDDKAYCMFLPSLYGMSGQRYTYTFYNAKNIGWLRKSQTFDYVFDLVKNSYPNYTSDGVPYYDYHIELHLYITGTNFELKGLDYYNRLPTMPSLVKVIYSINGATEAYHLISTPTIFPNDVTWVDFSLPGYTLELNGKIANKIPLIASYDIPKLNGSVPPQNYNMGLPQSYVLTSFYYDTTIPDLDISHNILSPYVGLNTANRALSDAIECSLFKIDENYLESAGYQTRIDSDVETSVLLIYTKNLNADKLYPLFTWTVGKLDAYDSTTYKFLLFHIYYTIKVSITVSDSTGTYLSDTGKVKYSDVILPQNICKYTIADDMLPVKSNQTNPAKDGIKVTGDTPLWLTYQNPNNPNGESDLFGLTPWLDNNFSALGNDTNVPGSGTGSGDGNNVNVDPYQGTGKNDLTILSQNSNLNKWRDETTLDLSARVLDCVPRIKSDIRYNTGREELIVYIPNGTYEPYPYDIILPSILADKTVSQYDLFEPGNQSGERISNMSPFCPYIGPYHQNYPMFLESYSGDEYTFVNLVGLKINRVRQKDSTGEDTYNWLKSTYNDFIRSHSAILCYYLGISDKQKYLTFDVKDPDGKDWRGAPIKQDSTGVVEASSVLQDSIQYAYHGNYIREGFLIDSNGKWTYYTSVYYDRVDGTSSDDAPTKNTRLITFVDLTREHILELTKNGRNFGDSPRIIRVYVKDPSDDNIVHFDGYYAINRNGVVSELIPDGSVFDAESAILDVIRDDDKIPSVQVASENLKYALYSRDIDISIVVDLTNRFSSMYYPSSQENSSRVPFLQSYGGWLQCDIDNNGLPIILQLQQIDFVKNTALLATNNDIVLKERVK